MNGKDFLAFSFHLERGSRARLSGLLFRFLSGSSATLRA